MGQFCPDFRTSPPEFPYDFVNVGVARDLCGITVKNGADLVQQVPVVQQQPSATSNAVQRSQQQQNTQQEQPVVQQQVQQQIQPPQNVSCFLSSVYKIVSTLNLRIYSFHQNAVPALPPGWVALQDPSSGMTYYANVRRYLISTYIYCQYYIYIFIILSLVTSKPPASHHGTHHSLSSRLNQLPFQ
jgi:hypothetical protein